MALPAPSSVRRIAAALATMTLCTALTGPGSARAQAQFAVPIAAEVVIVPLLLLLGVGVASMNRSDESSIRDLERVENWRGLERLATRRLGQLERGDPTDAAKPQEKRDASIRWHVVRAHARRQQGNCAGAVEDGNAIQALSGRMPEPLAEDHVACLLTLERWEAAASVYASMATAAPERWEHWYRLSFARARIGDAAGAAAARQSLEALNPRMAAALGRNLREGAAGTGRVEGTPDHASPVITGPDLASARVPGLLVPAKLSIGTRTLLLPPGVWMLASRRASIAQGRIARQASVMPVLEVPTLEGIALSSADGATIDAALSFRANTRGGGGISDWATESCTGAQGLRVDRFAGRFDTPECLVVRRLAASSLQQSGSPWSVLVPEAAASGVTPLQEYFEVRYARYGIDTFVEVAMLVPAASFTSDDSAIAWAYTLATRVRPLIGNPHGQAVLPTPP